MQIVKRTEDDVEINLLGVVQLLWGKIWTILFCGLFCAVLVFGCLRAFVTPKYTAVVKMYVNNSDSSDTTSITQSDLTASAKLVDTYAAIISSNTVLTQVLEEAGVDGISPGALESMISTASVNDTEVFVVSVEDSNPGRAALLANTIAEVAPVSIAEIVEGSSVKVVDTAEIPTEISSPHYKQLTLLGGGIGFLLSCIVILIRELMDTSVKSEADLDAFKVPVLCVMPEFDLANKMDRYGYGYGTGKNGGKE